MELTINMGFVFCNRNNIYKITNDLILSGELTLENFYLTYKKYIDELRSSVNKTVVHVYGPNEYRVVRFDWLYAIYTLKVFFTSEEFQQITGDKKILGYTDELLLLHDAVIAAGWIT
jgi:hypothetical protein